MKVNKLFILKMSLFIKDLDAIWGFAVFALWSRWWLSNLTMISQKKLYRVFKERLKKNLYLLYLFRFFNFNKVYIWPSIDNDFFFIIQQASEIKSFIRFFSCLYPRAHTDMYISLPQLLIFLIMRWLTEQFFQFSAILLYWSPVIPLTNLCKELHTVNSKTFKLCTSDWA